MIICVKCGNSNDDQSPVCERCGWKLQSQRVEPRAPRIEVPQLSLRRRQGGFPLMSRAVEVGVVSVGLVVALGYGLATGRWWPVGVAAAFGVGLMVWRRKWHE